MAEPTTTPDVTVRRSGSLFLFDARTDVARAWIDEHVDADATYLGDLLVVEHRYAVDLARGMLDDGLRVT